MGAAGKMSDSLGVNQSKPVEATEMDDLTGDVAAFFDQHEAVYPLYELFCEKLLVEFPDTRVKVQKSQISYYNRHLYACVSFLKVRKKAELPEDYFVLMLGLPAPLESGRVAAKTEPYPGRWTTHFVITDPPTWTRRRSAGSRKRTGSRRGSRAWAWLPPSCTRRRATSRRSSRGEYRSCQLGRVWCPGRRPLSPCPALFPRQVPAQEKRGEVRQR